MRKLMENLVTVGEQKLKEKQETDMKKDRNLRLIITVDMNDADYNTEMNTITEEDLEKLLPVFEAIQNFKPYKGKSGSQTEHAHRSNWPHGEYVPREDLGEKFPKEIYAGILTEDQCEMFTEYCPFGEHGFHSVVDITVLEVIHEKAYLKRGGNRERG
jgi:hypothetical protein